MIERTSLGLSEARTALDAILEAAGDGAPIAAVVVDADGDTIAYARMDGSTFLSRAMAVRKAYTSARMGADSGALGASMGAAGINLSELDPQYAGHGGAICVRADDQVVGAVGVSGRSPGQDEDLARTGAAALGL
jgi:glc operon protein GlcG